MKKALVFWVISPAFVVPAMSYTLFGIYLYQYQTSYIYLPTRESFRDCPTRIVKKLDWNGTDIFYRKNDPDRLLIFFHGNYGSACRIMQDGRLPKTFEKYGYSWMIPEYSGFGGRDGDFPSRERIFRDVLHVAEAVRELKQSNPSLIVGVIGESLGSAFAVRYSEVEPPAKLALLAPFVRLSEVAKERFPLYPVRTILLLGGEEYDNTGLAHYRGELLIMHGRWDKVIPFRHGEKLFKLSRTEKKTFYAAGELPDDGHNLLADRDVQEFLIRFFKETEGNE